MRVDQSAFAVFDASLYEICPYEKPERTKQHGCIAVFLVLVFTYLVVGVGVHLVDAVRYTRIVKMLQKYVWQIVGYSFHNTIYHRRSVDNGWPIGFLFSYQPKLVVW